MPEDSKVRSEVPKEPKATTQAKALEEAKADEEAKVVVAKAPKYKVIRHLSHDGQDYLPGALVPLDDETAELLATSGVIEPNEIE